MIYAASCSGAWAQGRASVTVSPVSDTPSPVMLIIDGKVVEADSLQFLRGQQVMVWLRDLETLGWGKTASGESGEVIFKGDGVTLSFRKGEGLAKVNSLAVKLPVDTYVRGGRLMVPLSFVAKALGFSCEIAYKPVASITTNAACVSSADANTLQGKVVYANKGIAGITVRAVDKKFNVITGAVDTTDADGSYAITNLPSGEFAAYVYTGDNPAYFNRASEFSALSDGEVSSLKPIALGRILSPKNPKPGDKVKSVNGLITLEWTKCDSASSYEISINKKGDDEHLVTITSKETKAQIAADKLKPGTIYEVEVLAADANGDFLGGTAGTGGKPWQFTLQSQ